MINHFVSEDGDFIKSDEIESIDNEKEEITRIISENIIGQTKYKLIGEPSLKWIHIDEKTNAIEISYRRTGNGNNTTHGTIYLLYNYSEMVRIIISYREQEKDMWMYDFDKIIKSFKWKNIKTRNHLDSTNVNTSPNESPINKNDKKCSTYNNPGNDYKQHINIQKHDNFVTKDATHYTIKYPSKWVCINKPDPMTDVYIGHPTQKLGCSILFVNTEYSLEELNKEALNNITMTSGKPIHNERITINGQPCYKTINYFTIGNAKGKRIMYTFKKKGTMYSVSFGTDIKEVDNNIALIDSIINTFNIK